MLWDCLLELLYFMIILQDKSCQKAPTPLEVEMDKYDKDISESVIDREGGK